MKFTVLGAKGFVGSHLVVHLRQEGMTFSAPLRDSTDFLSEDCGHLVYCIGLTADFRNKPFETVQAHVSFLADVLRRARFRSFTYLSSTRVYQHAVSTEEDAILQVSPTVKDDLYNISKIMGESLCLSCGRDNVRVVRLSNVVGEDFSSTNFLTSLLHAAVKDRRVVLQTALDSEKDYVGIKDVVRILPAIAASGRENIYNVAGGINVSHRVLVEQLRDVTGCVVEVAPSARVQRFPMITIRRAAEEFAFKPESITSLWTRIVSKFAVERGAS